MNQQEYESYWSRALINGEDTSSSLGIPCDRLKIYQNYVSNHYLKILPKMFPRFHKEFNPDWKCLAKQYYEIYPPKAYELNNLTKNFADFIKEVKEFPEYVFDLIRYELAEFYVFVHKSAVVQSPNDLLQINPSHELLVLDFDIPSWVFESERSKNYNKRPKKDQTILVISRNPKTLKCVFTKLTIVSAKIYSILEGTPLLLKQLHPLLPDIEIEQLSNEINFLKKQSIILDKE